MVKTEPCKRLRPAATPVGRLKHMIVLAVPVELKLDVLTTPNPVAQPVLGATPDGS